MKVIDLINMKFNKKEMPKHNEIEEIEQYKIDNCTEKNAQILSSKINELIRKVNEINRNLEDK